MSENQRVIQDDVATAIFNSVRDKQAAMDETKAAIHVLRHHRAPTVKRSKWLPVSLWYAALILFTIGCITFGIPWAVQSDGRFQILWGVVWTLGYVFAISAFRLAKENRERIDALLTLISHGEMDTLKDALSESKKIPAEAGRATKRAHEIGRENQAPFVLRSGDSLR
jgi:hypothetical protein